MEIIKVLGKEALHFRGHRNESAYILDNDGLNYDKVLATV